MTGSGPSRRDEPLRQWLGALDLLQYAESFERNDVSLDLLTELSEADLDKLGLSLGHRKRLLKAIAALEPTERGQTPRSERSAVLVGAERRQLSVLFCDLVGSTQLSERLDPEQYRELVHGYQQTCARIIARYDGYVAQYLGDGLLTYFGFPTAHEDDAQRAVRAGLAMVEAVPKLSPTGTPLAIRIGIHTGVVVVGPVGSDESAEQLALGDTPNVAARLLGMAHSNSLVLSERTRQLSGGAFEYRDLGPLTLKGIASPVHAWQVVAESNVVSRFEAATGGMVAPMIGREEELGTLRALWLKASQADGQVVLLAGEPGIGKSRLMRAIREEVGAKASQVISLQCAAHHTNAVLHPIIEHLRRVFCLDANEGPVVQLQKLEDAVVKQAGCTSIDAALIAALLGLPYEQRFGPLQMAPERQKPQTLRALVDLLAATIGEGPALVLYEDVHWADPTTLESLDELIDRVARLPLLLILSYRHEFKPPWLDLPGITVIRMSRLRATQSVQIIERICRGRKLPEEVSAQIVDKTGGVPLFIEELTKTVLESGLLTQATDRYELTAPLPVMAIPATVRDSLMARLDRLGTAKEVAQIGACIGRQFGYELTALVAPLPKADLNRGLEQLSASELVFRRGDGANAVYVFRHALIQDAAYDSLLKSRRAQLHAQIAHAVERHFPERSISEPELLGHHYTEAGMPAQAMVYWQRAGRGAAARFAYREAAAYFRKALEALAELPHTTERDLTEMQIQLDLGAAVAPLLGWGGAEMGAAFGRAQALSEELGREAVSAVLGVFWFRILRAEHRQAAELAERAIAHARLRNDPWLAVEAELGLGYSRLLTGRAIDAVPLLESSVASYQHGRTQAGALAMDLKAAALNHHAVALWILGYPDRARVTMRAALDHARQLDEPFSIAVTVDRACWIYAYHHEWEQVEAYARQTLALSEQRGFATFADAANIWLGHARAQGRMERAGIEQTLEGIARMRLHGTRIVEPLVIGGVAQGLIALNAPREALAHLEEVMSFSEQSGECWCDAELLRLKGEALLLQDGADHAGAEACFRTAIDTARAQQARSLELRAACSLAKLLEAQGRQREALHVLRPVYEWFTEGRSSKDHIDAATLLRRLNGI